MLASADSSLSEVLGSILGASPDGLQSLDAIIKQLDELRISVKDEVAIESITHLQNVLNLLFNTPYSTDNIGAITDGILNIGCAFELLNGEFDEKSIGSLTDSLYALSTCLTSISESFDGAENIAAAMNSFFALLNIDEKKLENVDVVVENFNKFTLIKFDEIKEKIIELTPHLEKLKDLITEIKNLFGEELSSCAEVIKANSGNISKITEGIDNTQEQLINGVMSIDHAAIKAAADNIGSIAALITLGGAMMLLGGWILQKNPDLIKGSIQFGLVLAAFLLLILTPITLAAVVAGKLGGTFKDFDKIVDFIWVGAAVMTLGALICFIPGFAESSLQFSKLLAVFLFSILLPVGILVAIAGIVDSGTEIMQDMAVFIATCAVVMTIGALFTLIPNFGIAAIGFGKVFFAFLMELIIPLALVSLISKFADGGALESLSNFIVKVAAVMTIGGLFVLIGGGKFAAAAIAFGSVFGEFLLSFAFALAIASLLTVFGWCLDNVTDLVVKCSIVMTIGALFMLIGGGKFAAAALAFGVILSVFVALMLLPLGILSGSPFFWKSAIILWVFKGFVVQLSFVLLLGGLLVATQPKIILGSILFGLLTVAYVVLMLSIVKLIATGFNLKDIIMLSTFKSFVTGLALILMIGGLLMLIPGFGSGALLFAGLLTVFVLVMVGVLKLISLISTKKQLAEVLTFAYAVAIFGAILMLGALVTQYTGISNVLWFAGTLAVFTFIMEIVFLTISKMKTTKQMKDVLMFSIAVAILGVTLMFGALATQEAGWQNVLIFAGTLAVFTIIMEIVFLTLSKMKTTKQMKDVLTFSLAVGILGAVLMAGALVTKEAGWENVLIFAGTLLAFTTLSLLSLKLLSKNMGTIAKGAAAAVTFGIALALIGGTLLLFAVSAKILDGVGIVGFIATTVILALLIGMVVALGFALPAIGAGAGAALVLGLALASIAGALMLFSLTVKMWAEYEFSDVTHLCAIVGALAILFVTLAASMPAFIIGAVAGALLTAAILPLSISLGALGLVLKMNIQASQVEKFGDVIAATETMFDKLPGIGKLLKASLKGWALCAAVTPLIFATAGMLNIIKQIASAKLPVAFDKDGNPTEYTKLDVNKDVATAATFIRNVFNAIPTMFNSAPKLRYLLKACAKGWALAMATRPLITVVSNMLNIITRIASAKLPVAFDKDGNPTEYRTLDIKGDIGKASTFIGTVFRSIPDMLSGAPTYRQLWDMCWKAVILSYATRPLTTVVRNMIDLIIQIASAKIPEGFDEEGKATSYRQMNVASDVAKAAEFIKSVFLAIPDMLSAAPTYRELWDMCWKGVLLSYATRPLVSVVRNMISMITQIGSAKLPTGFDEEGKATGYEKIADINAEVGKAAGFIKTVFLAIPDILNAPGFPTYRELWRMCWKATDLSDAISPLVNVVKGTIDMITQIGNAKIPEGFNVDGTASGYRKINIENDIKEATKFIKQVFLAFPDIANTVINIGGTASFKHLAKTMSNFNNVVSPIVTAINSMINVIKNLAELRIPTGYDAEGNVTGYRTFNFDEDSPKVIASITSIVLCLSNAIDTVYKKNKDLIENMDKCEAILKIIEGMKGIAEFLGSMKDTIVAYADLRFPIYNKWGKVKEYQSFDADGLQDKVQKNITSLLTLLSKTMINSMNDESVKKLLKTETLEKFKSFTEAMKSVNEVLKSASEGYNAIDFSKVTPQKIEKNMPTITSLTSKLPATLYDSIDYIEKVKKITIVALTTKIKDFKEMFSPINEAFTGIGEIVKNKAFKNFNKTYEDQIINIGIFLTLLNAFIIESIHETQSLTKTKLKNYNDTIIALHYIIMNISILSKFVDELDISIITLDNVTRSARFIERIWVDLLSHIRALETNYPFSVIKFYNKETLPGIFHLFVGIRHIKGIVDSMDYDTLHTAEKTYNTRKFTETFIRLLNVIAEIDDISGPRVLRRYNKDFAEIINLSSQIRYLKHIIDSLEFDEANFHKVTSTYQFICAVKGLLFSMGDISTKTVEEKKFWGLITFKRKEKLDFKDLITDLSYYLISAKIIKQVVDTIKSVPTVEEELSFTYVLHKINEAGDSISESSIKKIDKEAKAVNKYIKAVNHVNIKAVDSVTRLIHEMNNLQEKSLNKFADAIANKLTIALNKLSKEINDADKSLAKADELREKRINAINKSIEKIQGIMAQTINIRVNGSVDDTEIDEDPKG